MTLTDLQSVTVTKKINNVKQPLRFANRVLLHRDVSLNQINRSALISASTLSGLHVLGGSTAHALSMYFYMNDVL